MKRYLRDGTLGAEQNSELSEDLGDRGRREFGDFFRAADPPVQRSNLVDFVNCIDLYVTARISVPF